MNKRRTIYRMIQPKGSESWVRIYPQELVELKRIHPGNITTERRESPSGKYVEIFITIEPSTI